MTFQEQFSSIPMIKLRYCLPLACLLSFPHSFLCKDTKAATYNLIFAAKTPANFTQQQQSKHSLQSRALGEAKSWL